MRNNLESDSLQQRRILGGIETGMVERIASIAADRFAMLGPALNVSTVDGAACSRNTSNIPRWSAGVRWKKLSHARIPWNDCLNDNVRISPTIHVCPGRRLRHSEINVGDESTPVTREPCAAMCRQIGWPDPHPRSITLAPFGSIAMKRSSQGLSFHAPRLRSSSQAVAWRS